MRGAEIDSTEVYHTTHSGPDGPHRRAFRSAVDGVRYSDVRIVVCYLQGMGDPSPAPGTAIAHTMIGSATVTKHVQMPSQSSCPINHPSPLPSSQASVFSYLPPPSCHRESRTRVCCIEEDISFPDKKCIDDSSPSLPPVITTNITHARVKFRFSCPKQGLRLHFVSAI